MSTDLRPLTPDAIGASVPRRGHWLVAALGRAVLRLIGWKVVGELPNVPRAGMIAAPHTSNYDGLVGVSAIQGLRLDIRFMAKHTLFRGPAGTTTDSPPEMVSVDSNSSPCGGPL